MVADAIYAKTQENVYETEKYKAVISAIAHECVRQEFTRQECMEAAHRFVFSTKQYGGRIEPSDFFTAPPERLYDYQWYLDKVHEGHRRFQVYSNGKKAYYRLDDGKEYDVPGFTMKRI